MSNVDERGPAVNDTPLRGLVIGATGVSARPSSAMATQPREQPSRPMERGVVGMDLGVLNEEGRLTKHTPETRLAVPSNGVYTNRTTSRDWCRQSFAVQ